MSGIRSTPPGSIERAIEIAVAAHAGQTDKGGAPYILHPLRVMLSLSDLDAQMAAVLHDVIEDGAVTPQFLREQGFPEQVVTAIAALTKVEGEDYETFIARVATDPLARRVKLADLHDNLDLARIPNPQEKDFARIEKYRRAVAHIEAMEAADSGA